MKLFQIPLEPAYPMAFQAVSEPPSASPKWQSFGCNKFRDVQALSAMRDTPSMVQKLLEEEREAVKSALQAVDEHMQLKKKEVEEVHRKLMKDEPLKDHIRSTFQMDLSKSNRSNRATSGYAPSYNPPVKIQQKPIFLEAIYEEDNDSGNLSFSSNRNEKRPERIRHSAIPRNTTAKSRCSLKDKVSSARPRGSELSVLPPIDMGWSNIPSDGCYTGPLNYRWQRVADNYIDSDLRVRSRRRCRSRALDTKLRLGYQEDDETEDECNGLVEIEMRLPRKRQITFGPPHSTSYSRWFSHFNSLDSHYN
ncbi:uncharacterized protein LOC118186381 isoform X2 [Stegodyphus dumicola]|uniref:uncharacterized protein LOC118186381 isoform X2 n=1 Tax=Stegodyphus dumicola TaxID=202533 RepID=UPI0015AFC64C|nr:uncharacterized protein LOC118186381 isoform X2 [Stegodyphus dumicola]